MNFFKREDIYKMLFFNIQSVTEYTSLDEFEKNDNQNYQNWVTYSNKKYINELQTKPAEVVYLENACFHPEFSKIVHISYGYAERGETDDLIGRKLKTINGSEYDIIKSFTNVLNEQYVIGNESIPRYIPILTGHNVIGHDIPLLIKRLLKYREQLKNELKFVIPLPIRHYLDSKPWDSNVMDTVNAWKFNGNDYVSLNIISDFLGLKKSENLMTKTDLNYFYWNNINEPDEVNKKLKMQSANYTNLAFQLVKELRVL